MFYLLPKFETFHQHQPNRSLVVLSLSLPLLAGAALDCLPVWMNYRFAMIAPLLPIALYGLIALTLPSDLSGIGSPTRNAVIATVLILALAAVIGRRQMRARWHWAGQPGTVLSAAFIFLIWWDPTGSAIVHSVSNDASDSDSQHLVREYAATSDSGGAGGFLQTQRDAQPPFRFFGIDESHWTSEKSRPSNTYSARFDQSEVVDILPGPRATRLQLEGIQGYNPVHIERYDEYLIAMNGQTQNYHVSEVLRAGVSSPLIDLLNVRYIVVPSGRNGEWDGAELIELGVVDRQVFADDHVRILENDSALPRAWIVHQARSVDPGEALSLLTDASFDPRVTAVIETASPEMSQPPAGGSESVDLLSSDSPDRMRLTARLDAPGLVVLSEIYDPGWNAYLDGKRIPVLVTNHILRSVPVPAGDHSIELRFEPSSLNIGLAITGATTAAIALIAISAIWLRVFGEGSRYGRQPSASGSRPPRTDARRPLRRT
jgi:hypothetical protein